VVVIGRRQTPPSTPPGRARRTGADVTVIYRREGKDMPAIPEETEARRARGRAVPLPGRPPPDRGRQAGGGEGDRGGETKLGEFDTSGPRRPVPTDEVVRVDCDSVILAVGEKGGPDFGKASGLKVKEAGTIGGRPLLARDEPRPLLRGGRPRDRRLERLERHALRAARPPARSTGASMGVKRVESLWPPFQYSMEPPEAPGPNAGATSRRRSRPGRGRPRASRSRWASPGGGPRGDGALPAVRRPCVGN